MRESTGSKLGKNFFLLTLGKFASSILTFLFVPLYTSVLSTEEYGIFDLSITTANLLIPILTLNISEAMMRFLLDSREKKDQIISIGNTITIVAIISFLLVSPVVWMIPTIRPYYLLFCVLFVVSSLNSAVTYEVQGFGNARLVAVAGIVSTGVSVVLNLLLLLVFQFGLMGYFIAMVTSSLSATFVLVVGGKLWKYSRGIDRTDLRKMQEMLLYSAPMIPNSISWWVSNSSDKYILTAFCGTAANGVYSVAYKIPTMITVFSGIFLSAWKLSAVDAFEGSEAERTFSKIYRNYFMFSVVITSGLIVINKYLAAFMYAKDFFVAWRYVPILCIAVMFNGLAGILGTIYTSAKKTNMLVWSSLVGALLNIVLNFIMIPPFGALGAAVATMIAFAVTWGIRIKHTKKIMSIQVDVFRNTLSVVIIVFQIILQLLNLPWCLPVVIILFVALIGVNIELIKEILQLKERMYNRR